MDQDQEQDPDQVSDQVPELRLMVHCSGLKNINNKARQSGAPWVVLLSEQEGEQRLRVWHDDQPVDGLTVPTLVSSLQQQF